MASKKEKQLELLKALLTLQNAIHDEELLVYLNEQTGEMVQQVIEMSKQSLMTKYPYLKRDDLDWIDIHGHYLAVVHKEGKKPTSLETLKEEDVEAVVRVDHAKQWNRPENTAGCIRDYDVGLCCHFSECASDIDSISEYFHTLDQHIYLSK